MRLPWKTRKDHSIESLKSRNSGLAHDVARLNNIVDKTSMNLANVRAELKLNKESNLKRDLLEAINLIVDYQKILHRLDYPSPDPARKRAHDLLSKWGVVCYPVHGMFKILVKEPDGTYIDWTEGRPDVISTADQRRLEKYVNGDSNTQS